MPLTIQFTESADQYIQNMLNAKSALGLRLSIKKTGCSGYAYVPSMVTEVNNNDFEIEQKNFRVYIDPLWAHVMDGLVIDYVQEEKSGLKQKRLVFSNPNESARCGCGESFQLK